MTTATKTGSLPTEPGMSHLGDPRCRCGSRVIAAGLDVSETCKSA